MHATFKTPLEIIDFKLRKIKKDIKEHLCLKGIRNGNSNIEYRYSYSNGNHWFGATINF
jgi:hypothetical protein